MIIVLSSGRHAHKCRTWLLGTWICRPWILGSALIISIPLSCGTSTRQNSAASSFPTSLVVSTALDTYPLSGNTTPVRDPSLILQGSTYYVFSTDPAPPDAGGYLPIRCSSDRTSWTLCGYVFRSLPAWVHSAVPSAINLWAPDISYFHGAYHLYYAASTLFSQVSAIGEATNVTLDPSSPQYQWVDHGEVLASTTGGNFNAIDPNILVDNDGSVWLTYGSFWSGIKQQPIDPATGMLAATNPTVYSLAYQPAADHALEGSSLLHHGSYYYLFLSAGHCCEATLAKDDYQQIVGRSTSSNGPFYDLAGVDLEAGGGTLLLTRNSTWAAPGGGSAYVDPVSGESLLTFHAASVSADGAAYLWIKTITWQSDWPVLN